MDKIKPIVRKWAWRFAKYNLIGIMVFLLNLTFYYLIFFPAFGEQAYIFVSILGGIIEFSLIACLNKTKKGSMFDSFPRA